MSLEQFSRECERWSDEYLLQQFMGGPASYAAPAYFEIVSQEVSRRGLSLPDRPTVRSIGAVIQEILAVPDPVDRCHSCQATTALNRHHFAVLKPVEEDWRLTAASAAVSVLLSVMTQSAGAMIFGPRRTAYVLEMDLRLCDSCQRTRRSFFGGVRLIYDDYALHPRFQPARERGFTEWITGDGLKKWRAAS